MRFPETEADFLTLADQGKTVEYAETPSAETSPEGEGWEYWSDRRTDGESVAVWRRIVPIETPQ